MRVAGTGISGVKPLLGTSKDFWHKFAKGYIAIAGAPYPPWGWVRVTPGWTPVLAAGHGHKPVLTRVVQLAHLCLLQVRGHKALNRARLC